MVGPMLPLALPETPKPRQHAQQLGAWLVLKGGWHAIFDRFSLCVQESGDRWQWRIYHDGERFAWGAAATKRLAQAAAPWNAFQLSEAQVLDLDMQTAVELRAQFPDRRGRPRAHGSAVRDPPRETRVMSLRSAKGPRERWPERCGHKEGGGNRMGQAKRRKLAGTYPTGGTPERHWNATRSG
jgi:hypothetical protein